MLTSAPSAASCAGFIAASSRALLVEAKPRRHYEAVRRVSHPEVSVQRTAQRTTAARSPATDESRRGKRAAARVELREGEGYR
jgi:hypothetical protein